MRISKRLINTAIALSYYRDIHGMYCKMCASSDDCDGPEEIRTNCHYGHINVSAIIKTLENKIRRITSR
jgi:hypothetical protein